jgi:hypothetical protein
MRFAAALPTEELTPMGGLSTRQLLAATVVLGLVGLFAPAAQAHHWQLESATLPAPFLRDGRMEVGIEPSGVAPIGDGRRVLVAHDEAAPLYVVDVATGALVGAPLVLPKFPPTTKSGPKWEGMALDSGGNYYLVGSCSGPSDEERAASSAVVRFRLQGGETPAIDDTSVVRWDIFHGNTLWLVADGETRRARSYATFEVAMKAAGLAVLGVEASGHLTRIKLLITYDNDPHATKIPSRFQTATLVHERS